MSIYEDGTYLKNSPNWHQADSAWKAAHIARMLSRNGVQPVSVAEIGCGAGEVLRSLSTMLDGRVQYSGFEISPQAFQICQPKAKGNLSYFYADLLAESEDKAFDVLMAIDVFEHVEDYFSFLRKVRTRGAYKVFHIPLDLSVQTVIRPQRLMRARNSVGHIHYFTKETALATLQDTGYDILDSFYTCGSIELPNRGWKANLMKLPRNLAYMLSPDYSVRVLGGFSMMVLAK